MHFLHLLNTKETNYFSINQRDADFLCLMLRIIVWDHAEAVENSFMFMLLEKVRTTLIVTCTCTCTLYD